MIYENRERFTDAENNMEWKSLLSQFHSILEIKGDKTDALNALKEKAKSNPYLTDRQQDAIRGRCVNAQNGTYGSTSRTVESHKK